MVDVVARFVKARSMQAFTFSGQGFGGAVRRYFCTKFSMFARVTSWKGRYVFLTTVFSVGQMARGFDRPYALRVRILEHRRRQFALAHGPECIGNGVDADDRNFSLYRLKRADRAERHLVVLGHDGVEFLAGQQPVFRQLERLKAIPVRRLLDRDLDLRILLQHRLDAGGSLRLGRTAENAAEDGDVALAIEDFGDVLHGDSACFNIVGADEGVGLVLIDDLQVDQDDRDMRRNRLVDRLRATDLIDRVQDDGVDLLRDEVLDVENLRLDKSLPVALKQRDAKRSGSCPE